MVSPKNWQPSSAIPLLTDKVIIVTGGNTGLGLETILQLAAHSPGHIYLAARTASKAESAIATVKKNYPDVPITHLSLDLTSFASIATAASTFLSASSRLDILINNAGVMALPAGQTAEGYEIQFGTNHIGHALFTHLLMPRLVETAAKPDSDVRIVNLSSAGHRLAPKGGIVFEELNGPMANWLTWRRYGQSKLANILFTEELARRYPNITSVAVHPGVIKTDLYASFEARNPLLKYGMALTSGLFMIGVPDGAKNQLWAATAKKEDIVSGGYYEPVASKSSGSAYVGIEKLAEKLWEWTEGEFKKHGR